MDSGWAVILGASIALIGSAVIPWIRDSITDGQRRRRERREETHAALLATVVSLATALMVSSDEERRVAFVAEISALSALDLLLSAEEKDVAQIALVSASMIRAKDPKGADAMAALSEVFAGWQRGVVADAAVFSSWMEMAGVTEKDLAQYR